MSPLLEQELKKDGKDPMLTEGETNGELSKDFKETQGDGKKSQGGEEPLISKIKDPEEGTNGSCFNRVV